VKVLQAAKQMSPILPLLVIWALVLALVTLAGFGVGAAFGRRPFVREKNGELLVYLGIVGVCVLLSALELALPFKTPMAMIDCWLLVVMFAITVVTPVVVAIYVREGLAYRRRRQNDPDLCCVCRYCLIGNESGVCPECGTRLTAEQCDHIREETRFRGRR
jgi:uncharacterized membrane protein YedE/YeeE